MRPWDVGLGFRGLGLVFLRLGDYGRLGRH